MDASTISIVAIVIAIGAVAYGFYSSKQPVTAANVATAIQAVPSIVTEVEKAATVVVQSYEQARRKGNVESTPDLNAVMNQVRGWLPEAIKSRVTNEQVITAINSAILMASTATATINAAKTPTPVIVTLPPAAVAPAKPSYPGSVQP